MIKSLKNHCDEFEIKVLCLDEKTKEILESINIREINCISLKEVETEDLLILKKERSTAEYCWTLASTFTWYVLQNNDEIDLITYLDADLFFYSNVEPIFEEIGNSSIAIIEHRFAPEFQYLETNGKFCVEWNSFRRDSEGITCLDTWRKQCLEWCYYKNEKGRMGDQKYLDEWPYKYKSCHIIKNLGAGIAPWNYSQYQISVNNNSIRINNKNLIFYHFHQFQILENNKFFRLGEIYSFNREEPFPIYEFYEKQLLVAIDNIREIDDNFNYGILKSNRSIREKIKYYLPLKIKKIIRRFI